MYKTTQFTTSTYVKLQHVCRHYFLDNSNYIFQAEMPSVIVVILIIYK